MTDRALPSDLPTGVFINGRWLNGEKEPIAVENPATGRELSRVANADPEQGMSALAAAESARRSWADTPPRERSNLLRAAFDEVVRRADDFARLMTLEMGKPLAESHGEVAYGAEFLRWFSEEAVRVHGRQHLLPEGTLEALVVRRPVGPSLLLTPWNFPLAMATRKVAPALAAGCTVVVRPSSTTPLTTLLFAKVLADVGVPAGVINVITSSDHDVTDAIIADPRLRKLSFTGSTPVGTSLLKQAADNVLRTSMELGGNAPFIVYEDADLDVAVAAAKAAKLRNMGQACTAANRFIVHSAVAGEFAERLAAEFARQVVGDGLSEGTTVGPLVSQSARADVHSLVTAAVARGGRLLTGGEIPDGPGWFYPPTVITDLSPEAEILTTEIFGPVAAITTFSNDAEALRIANDSPVGLSGYVCTANAGRVRQLAQVLEVGMIGVNTGVLSNAAAPFGGVKQSGLGREGSFEGIDEYLETVYVALPR